MVRPIEVVDCPFEWAVSMSEMMTQLIDIYSVLESLGTRNLVTGLVYVRGQDYAANIFIESFLRLVSTYIRTLGAGEGYPITREILEWNNNSISDVGYDSRVRYSRALEELFLVLTTIDTSGNNS